MHISYCLGTSRFLQVWGLVQIEEGQHLLCLTKDGALTKTKDTLHKLVQVKIEQPPVNID